MQKMQAKINQLGILFCTIFFLTSQPLLGEEIPLLKSPKVDNPKSVLFIGNSFFYYNNGVHKPVLGMVKANASLGKGHRFRNITCLLYTSPSPRDLSTSRMPSSA